MDNRNQELSTEVLKPDDWVLVEWGSESEGLSGTTTVEIVVSALRPSHREKPRVTVTCPTGWSFDNHPTSVEALKPNMSKFGNSKIWTLYSKSDGVVKRIPTFVYPLEMVKI